MLYDNYLKTLKTCPFCKVENREFISSKNAFLTYAKAPYHPHHLLVVPKRHVISLFDLSKKEKQEIDVLIEKGLNLLKKLKYKNLTVLVREGNGKNSDKSIKHVHYHLIPNDRIGDLDHKGEMRKILSEKEIKNLSTKIRSLI